MLTKAEVSEGNAAMPSVLRNGTYRLASEVAEMQLRHEDPHRKQRDRSTSAALMREAHGLAEEDSEVTRLASLTP